ncbi:hypothetical protein ACKWTF_010182 [Chironomus riparius]
MGQLKSMEIILVANFISMIIFNIGLLEAASINGYFDNETWTFFKMKIYAFNINSNSEIPNDNMEISLSKSECVKGFYSSNNKNIKYLPVNVYKKLPNLVGYSMRNAMVKSISYKNFENLKELQLIDLFDNHLSTISNDTFKDTTELKKIILEDNLLKSIDRNTFDSLKKLIYICLAKNEIETVFIYAFEH